MKWLKVSYLCRNVDFQIKSKPKETKIKVFTVYVRFLTSEMGVWLWNVIQTRAKFEWSMFSNFGKGSVNGQSEMSLFDTTGFVRSLVPVQPAGVPFTPKSSWALTSAALALKAELFSAQAYREPPHSLPQATSHSAAEITLFILCIIVSSWMQILCRHLSELN